MRAARRELAWIVLLLVLVGGCAARGRATLRLPAGPPLEPGDLVFLDLDCGPTCDAVERVTAEQLGVPGPALSHAVLVVEGGARPRAIEAWPRDGVVERPLDEILARVQGGEGEPNGYWIARLRSEHRGLGRSAAAAARRLLGRAYDEVYVDDDARLYCAELVLRAFDAAARPGLSPFRWLPMRFGRKGTPERIAWEAYYRGLRRSVPEGLPGVSPLGLYLQGRSMFLLSKPASR